ncbi:PREDICTED: G-protein coupled receptor Mth2-like [Wasmannia auropunctata]|uniref:G-protein coupled receptor Mth2-like n=1 Tax=Wasmannia auropunctata TaxID=64793 RepID=UPI0005F007DD|nr:PREDICTED: G-protein coupled receptor Mth2-like [Wasmannia auropunctata]
MCPSSIVLCCYALLFVASSSESRGISTNGDEQGGDDSTTVRYDLFEISLKNRDDNKIQFIPYNLHESSTENDDDTYYKPHQSTNNDHMDLVRYESRGHVMKIREENNKKKFMEPRVISGKVSSEDDSTLQEFHNSFAYKLHSDKDNDTIIIFSSDACGDDTCIQLCCPFGERLTSGRKCVPGQDNYAFPGVQNNSENKKLDELFRLTVRDPCVQQRRAHRILDPDEYAFFANGSLYLNPNELIPSTSYCLAVRERDTYDAVACMISMEFPVYMSVYFVVTFPLLVLTFVIYTILPQLRNMQSYILRVQVASLFITNMTIYCVHKSPELSEWEYCIPLAYIFNFTILSGNFWLNVASFDIWWTFRKLNLHHLDKGKKKKRFILYSIYAWGITLLLTAACAIMDAPGIPENWIQPEMCKKKFWFSRSDGFTLFYYGPTGVTFIINIYFFIITAVTILYHNKHTAHQLKDSQSRRYNKNKRKFGMYLKLFVVMGVSWSTDVILWFIHGSYTIPEIIWNISFMISISRSVIIFIIYVCRKRILRLLLKRFGWKNRGQFRDNSSSNQNGSSSNMSSISVPLPGSVHMKNISPSISQPTNHHAESNTTFRKFHSYQTNIMRKNQEKKKFIMYSIFAWGVAFILNVVRVIMDIFSDSIRPKMCKNSFWLSYEAITVYFYIPASAAISCNIFFFTATILKVRDKQTMNQLRDLESSRHNKNKFTIYLKLFIVMGINWIVKIIIFWSNENFVPPIFWLIFDAIDNLQGFIIFVIYVCKRRILRLLQEEFVWKNPVNISRNNDCPNASVNTTSLTSISTIVSMQEINPTS